MKWMKGIVEIMECSVQLAVVVSDCLNVSHTRSIHNEVSDLENMEQVHILDAILLL